MINALISRSGFHLATVDIFESDQFHSMNSDRFVKWIKQTSGILRSDAGKK